MSKKSSPSSLSASSSAPDVETTGSYHHGNLKASLIEAAMTILQRDGADALSLRAIAAEVGVSHTAPYSHFKNKKELIEAISAVGYELLAKSMLEAESDTADYEEVVLDYGTSYLTFALDNPELYRLMLGQVEARGLKSGVKPVPLDLNQETITLRRPFLLLRGAFEKGLKDRDLAKQQALGAWALVHGLSALLIEGYLNLPESGDLRQFLRSITLQRNP